MNKLWIISYDIEDDEVRNNVHELLQDYGDRVQYSVFECWLNETRLSNLREELQALIEDNDSLRWYPLCRICNRNIDWQGKSNNTKQEHYFIL